MSADGTPGRKLKMRDIMGGMTLDSGIVSLERCAVCDSRQMPPKPRLELLLRTAKDAIDEVLEDVPKRPNNLCPTHWAPFIDLRNGGVEGMSEDLKKSLGIGWRKE